MSTNSNTLNVKQAVPFFLVRNMVNSLAFYVNKLGFVLKNKWEPRGSIEWCWLQMDDAAIMLQQFGQPPQTGKQGLGVSVCFICMDALAIYKDLISKGLSLDDPFVGNNMWVVKTIDPDGYELFFESATDVPEETTYTDWIKSTNTK